jgi:hypothetical protein
MLAPAKVRRITLKIRDGTRSAAWPGSVVGEDKIRDLWFFENGWGRNPTKMPLLASSLVDSADN